MNSVLLRINQQHVDLIHGFKMIQEKSDGTQEAKELYLKVKNLFLAHLKFEDKVFYPALTRAAESNQEWQKILGQFTREMRKIMESVMVFLEHDNLSNKTPKFIKAFQKINQLFNERIVREEQTLFPIYEKAMDQRNQNRSSS